jgi:hypothetical protein
VSQAFRVPFEQAPVQRLVDGDGRPYWIEIRRGNDLVKDWPMFNGFAEIAWLLSRLVRRAAWALDLTPRTWRVLEFDTRDGYKVFPPVRDQVVRTRQEAVDLAEAWRSERT